MFLHQAESSQQLLGALRESFAYFQKEFDNRCITLPSNEYIKAGEQEIAAFTLFEWEQNIKAPIEKNNQMTII